MRASARKTNQSRDRHSTSATNIAWFVVVMINIRTRFHIVSLGIAASRVISGGNVVQFTSVILQELCNTRVSDPARVIRAFNFSVF